MLGQLVDKTNLDSIGEEVNEKLQQYGKINIGDISKQYELPPDFILEVSFRGGIRPVPCSSEKHTNPKFSRQI